MRRLAFILCALVVGGCGVLPILRAGPPIPLRHPTTGHRVECEAPRVPTGPYGIRGTEQSASMQRECIEDFMRQGYVRVAE